MLYEDPAALIEDAAAYVAGGGQVEELRDPVHRLIGFMSVDGSRSWLARLTALKDSAEYVRRAMTNAAEFSACATHGHAQTRDAMSACPLCRVAEIMSS